MHVVVPAGRGLAEDVGVVTGARLIILNLRVLAIGNLRGENAVVSLRVELLAFFNNGGLVIGARARNITRWVQLVLNLNGRFEEFALLLRCLEVANSSPRLVRVDVGVVEGRSNRVLLLPTGISCLLPASIHVGVYFPGWN